MNMFAVLIVFAAVGTTDIGSRTASRQWVRDNYVSYKSLESEAYSVPTTNSEYVVQSHALSVFDCNLAPTGDVGLTVIGVQCLRSRDFEILLSDTPGFRAQLPIQIGFDTNAITRVFGDVGPVTNLPQLLRLRELKPGVLYLTRESL